MSARVYDGGMNVQELLPGQTAEQRLLHNRVMNARRAAFRQGATLRKSRTRDPRGRDYGKFWFILGSGEVIGTDELGWPCLTLEDAEALIDQGLNAAAA